MAQFLAANTDLAPHVVDAMAQSGSPAASSAAQLVSLAENMLETFSNSFLIVDAIDECDTEERKLLIESLNHIACSSIATKVIFLSREESDIQRAMISFPSYGIKWDGKRPRMSWFLHGSMTEKGDYRFDIEMPLRSELKRELLDGEKKSLCVRLTLNTIKSQLHKSSNEAKDALTQLPLKLISEYVRLLHRLLQQPYKTQHYATTALKLIAVAYVPFHIQGLCYTSTVPESFKLTTVKKEQNLKQFIQETCESFVEISEIGILKFTHQAVAEVLTSAVDIWEGPEGTEKQVARICIDSRDAHETMARCCIACLVERFWISRDETVFPRYSENLFLDYSAMFWADHVADSKPAHARLYETVEAFLASENAVMWLTWWLQTYGRTPTLIGKLIVVEHKLRWWAKTTRKQPIRDAIATCILDLYDRLHRGLLMRVPESDPRVIESTNTFAAIQMASGQWTIAAASYSQNVKAASQFLGETHHLTLDAMNGLARAYAELQYWEKAVDLDRQVLQGRLQTKGELDRATLLAMDDLAGTLVKSITTRPGPHAAADGDVLIEASRLLDRSFSSRAKISMSANHLDYLNAWRMRAWSQMSMGDYAEAEKSLLQQQDLAKRLVGTEHRDYHHSMDDLGRVYEKTSQYAKAEATYQHVLQIREKIFGEEHPDVLGSLMLVATVQRERGKLQEAIANLSRMEPLTMKLFGRYPNKPSIMLAEIYIEQGRDDLAKPLLERYIQVYKYTSKADSERAAKAASDLANLYGRNGESQKAAEVKMLKFDEGAP